jgi:CubicO group peptidase (beta-lactamase class C family)
MLGAMKILGFAAACLLSTLPAPAHAQPADQRAAVFADIDALMEAYRLDAHIPGMVWGVVRDGRLVHVQGAGVKDTATKGPVTPDTLFRIASMTKAFTALTILSLRDEGKLSLDAPVEMYVPELKGWRYPTEDAPKIRVRDLLTHTAGLVTDDPWGDRQTPLPEAEFTRMLRDGVAFSRTPGLAMEYSNLGYALLGRIITNVAGEPYKDVIERRLVKALGMTSSGLDVTTAPAERRALGYRWEDDAWKLEPTMAHGAFGAMGGMQTSANDYAKWVAFLLAAWPARDGAETGPVRRASVRELSTGANFVSLRTRAGATGESACRLATAYAMGFIAQRDCDLGLTMSHGGGYPGYGSHVLLLPDYGLGIFAFANRTYAGPRPPVWDAAMRLHRAGWLVPRARPVSPGLAAGYAGLVRIFAAGSVDAARDLLAENVLMDRDAAHRARDLAALKAQVGACETTAPIDPTTATAGHFIWTCEHGRVDGYLLLAPTPSPRIQDYALTRATP